jgi:hypothetical protein
MVKRRELSMLITVYSNIKFLISADSMAVEW